MFLLSATPEVDNWKIVSNYLSEFFYICIGLIFVAVAFHCFKTIENNKRYTTAAFWLILALTFIAGPHVPAEITGASLVVLGLLTAFNRVVATRHNTPKPEETRANADRIGYKIFVPSLVLAIGAFLVATLLPKLGGNNSIGISAIFGFIALIIITKTSPKSALKDGVRLMDNVGTTSILPQLLAALGLIFTKAGVGDIVSYGVSHVVPESSKLIACVVYCLGMAIFTIIMGNGFAAFSVITVGIGVPFLIQNGADPVIVGALGLTAGYCGTLLTPMAANFNIVPAALLETKDKYSIIKSQAPYAAVLLCVHIVLMYVFAF